jgi:tetratricopeptide (TPR) repeat protein
MSDDLSKRLAGAPTTSKYLQAENEVLRRAVEKVACTVHSSANQAIMTIEKNRERISDATDYLDGVFVSTIEISQAAEITEISTIGEELNAYFDKAVHQQAFKNFSNELRTQINELERREKALKKKEEKLEQTIANRLAAAEAKIIRESTSARGLLESALQKAEKVFDQNKITRFAYSTISKFQNEFGKSHDVRDVEYVTKLFQETIEPFQKTKMVADKNGKLIKIVVNSFTESCYQDLFFFFYKYYNELLEIFEAEKEIPSTATELGRVFKSKQRDAEEIIATMHKRK